MSNPAPIGEPVDFEIAKENWSIFELSDETILRARIILAKVYKTKQYNDRGEPVYATGTQNMYITTSPAKIQNNPTVPPPSQDDINRSSKTEVEFHAKKDEWNEYKLVDGTIIRIKLVTTSVERTPFFGQDRNPIYFVNSQPVVRVIVPPQLKKLDSSNDQTRSKIIT